MPTTLTPNIMSDDVTATVRFYCERLGFQMLMGLPVNSEQTIDTLTDNTTLRFSIMERDGAQLMVEDRSLLAEECGAFAEMPVAASAIFYLEVADLNALLAGLGDGVETVVPERETHYGMRELWIKDNNGYVVTLAQRMK